jgi:TatD DNase family protein
VNASGPLWFDSHCHLEDEGTVEGAIDAARAAGVARIVSIGTDAARSQRAIDVAVANEGVWATVGLHPHDAKNGVETIEPLLAAVSAVSGAGAAKVVAVGECGLDYYYEHSPRTQQREAFEAQIALAKRYGLALVVHTRDAWDDTFQILARAGAPERTIIHCFTGGPEEARRCLDLGAYLSFSGIVTFPKALEVREAAALCPADRMLVETDAPYLAPVPHRGRPNQPALVTVVGRALSEVRGVPVSRIAADTYLNAAVAFGLEHP